MAALMLMLFNMVYPFQFYAIGDRRYEPFFLLSRRQAASS
jgi:hypothetical protein